MCWHKYPHAGQSKCSNLPSSYISVNNYFNTPVNHCTFLFLWKWHRGPLWKKNNIKSCNVLITSILIMSLNQKLIFLSNLVKIWSTFFYNCTCFEELSASSSMYMLITRSMGSNILKAYKWAWGHNFIYLGNRGSCSVYYVYMRMDGAIREQRV